MEKNAGNGYHKWDVHLHQQRYFDVFPKDSVVYLTSESDNILTDMNDCKAYVIGGLVDHNQHKVQMANLASYLFHNSLKSTMVTFLHSHVYAICVF